MNQNYSHPLNIESAKKILDFYPTIRTTSYFILIPIYLDLYLEIDVEQTHGGRDILTKFYIRKKYEQWTWF
jgi:hypothetical protein